MPKRIPVNTIILNREGKSFAPKIGVPFDFTQAELDDINKMLPGAVRKIINEDPVVETKASVDTATTTTATTATTGGKGRGAASNKAAEGTGDL